MGLKLKTCPQCHGLKKFGKTKKVCGSCRKKNNVGKHNAPVLHQVQEYVQRKKWKGRVTVGPFVNWFPYNLPKCIEPSHTSMSRVGLGSAQLNYVLKCYGYKDYNEYLHSPLWYSIRAEVLRGKLCACGCGKEPNQVHHRIYTEANIMGVTLKGLTPLHRDCHAAIEFLPCGKKAMLNEANRALDILYAKNKGG